MAGGLNEKTPDAALKYSIDREAQSLEIPFDQPDFSQKAIALLRSNGARSKAARILLERYIPEGPGREADADAWEHWIKENR